MCAGSSRFESCRGEQWNRSRQHRLGRVPQWSVRVVAAGAGNGGRSTAGEVLAADLDIAATGLCDRLAAPTSGAEDWYLLAAYLPDADLDDVPIDTTYLRWSNRLRWDGCGWTLGEWVPANGGPPR